MLQNAINNAIVIFSTESKNKNRNKIIVKDIKNSISIPNESDDKNSQLRVNIGEFTDLDQNQRQDSYDIILKYSLTATSNDDILIASDSIKKSVGNGDFTSFLREFGDNRFRKAKVTSDFLTIDHSKNTNFNSNLNLNLKLKSDSYMDLKDENIGTTSNSTSSYDSTSTSSSDSLPFCLPFVNGNIAYPFFTHYGPAGTTDAYNQFTPKSCDCNHPKGNPTGDSEW